MSFKKLEELATQITTPEQLEAFKAGMQQAQDDFRTYIEKQEQQQAAPPDEPPTPEALGLNPETADLDRVQAARKAAKTAEARQNLANEARTLLIEERLLSEESAVAIDDATALQWSGIEPTPEMVKAAEEKRILADPKLTEQYYAEREAQARAVQQANAQRTGIGSDFDEQAYREAEAAKAAAREADWQKRGNN